MKKVLIIFLLSILCIVSCFAQHAGRKDCEHNYNYSPLFIHDIDPNNPVVTRVCDECQRIEQARLSKWECISEESNEPAPTIDYDNYSGAFIILSSSLCQHNSLKAYDDNCWGISFNMEPDPNESGVGLHRLYICEDCGTIVHIGNAFFINKGETK